MHQSLSGAALLLVKGRPAEAWLVIHLLLLVPERRATATPPMRLLQAEASSIECSLRRYPAG